ncbi:DUF3656 domain-containing U32 family peptidase, partial [Mycobacterium tuberculosis]|uniref:DUF3656 domain-containing U32 family peptidase n=1 Tax=Mycobacterium tuberculosis TaxID=1773 RepID=UPI003312FCDC
MWKTDDPALTRRLRQTFSGPPKRRTRVDVLVRAIAGERLDVTVDVPGGRSVHVRSDEPLGRAERRAATTEMLREQFD